jgi:enamine deaminase RidA (YjgF/YER057c/UK114 family)
MQLTYPILPRSNRSHRPFTMPIARPSKKGWGGRYAQVVTTSGKGVTIHLAGQTAAPMPGSDEPENDLSQMSCREQAATILARIDRLLAENNAAKADLVRAWVFVHDPADVDEANAAWDEWMDVEGRLPARTCLVASPQGHTPHGRVEITVDAFVVQDMCHGNSFLDAFLCCCLSLD